jgi:hypothetical protein
MRWQKRIRLRRYERPALLWLADVSFKSAACGVSFVSFFLLSLSLNFSLFLFIFLLISSNLSLLNLLHTYVSLLRNEDTGYGILGRAERAGHRRFGIGIV